MDKTLKSQNRMLNVIWVLFLIPMCREECIITQRATISMRVLILIPMMCEGAYCGLVCTHNNAGIIFNTRVRRGWSLAVGWYVLTMMRVLFLIPVMCRTCLAEVGEHQ